MRRQTTGLLPLVLIAAQGALAHGAAAASPEVVARVPQLEQAYADFNDTYGAVSLIDSDPDHYAGSYAGRSRAAWQKSDLALREQ